MTHADDARDSDLLEAGDIAALLATYEPVIHGRCIARLKGSLDADDVAQDAKLRLLSEFRRGKRYGDLPYRVVVNKVIDWTLGDYFGGRPTEAPLPEGWDPSVGDDTDAIVSRYYLEGLAAALDGREREVYELRYVALREPGEIAAELGITRNNVDQAIFRAHRTLRELIRDE